MKLAHNLGIRLPDFWCMTPWHLMLSREARAERMDHEHNANMGYAWYNAAFQRATKLPPLKDVIGAKKEAVKKIDERAIMAQLRAYQARRDKVTDG